MRGTVENSAISHQNEYPMHVSVIMSRKGVLVDFFDFDWLDMLDIAYSSSTNCSRSLDNHPLPVWMA